MATQKDKMIERMAERQKTGSKQTTTLLDICLFIEITPIHKFYNKLGVSFVFCSFVVVFKSWISFYSEYFRCSIEYNHGYVNFLNQVLFSQCYFFNQHVVHLKTNVNEFVQICPKYTAFCCFVKSNTKIGRVNVNKQLVYSP